MARRGGSQSYEGTVPKAKGTGPKNLPKKTPVAAIRPSVKASKAKSPSASASKASAGVKGSPPRMGGSGIAKATTPMASAKRPVINKPKTRTPGNSRRIARPKADGDFQI